jgi:hypothetical protein
MLELDLTITLLLYIILRKFNTNKFFLLKFL